MTGSTVLRLALSLCCLFGLLASAARAADPAPSDPLCVHAPGQDAALQTGLREIVRIAGIDDAVADGRLALGVAVLPDDAPARLATLNGDRMLYAASLPKIAILLGAAVAQERGRIESTPELERDIQAMIRRSCNACSNRVLERVGGRWLQDLLRSSDYRLYDPDRGGGLWVGKPYGPEPAFRREPIAGLSHAATAHQVLRFYCGLEAGTLAGPEAIDRMRNALSEPAIAHKFVRGLQSRQELNLMRKSGTWRSFHSDSALIEDEAHRYILVALADDVGAGDWLERLAAPLAELARRESSDRSPGVD